MSSVAEPLVFVVDDDESIRESVAALLREAGFAFEVFASAEEFLGRADVDRPSCLILDIELRNSSGLDLQASLAQRMPIIFITGHGDIPSTVRAMKAGAIELLTKPFSSDDLLDAIARALTLDAASRKVMAEKQALEELRETLSAREREIMIRVVRGMLNKQIAAELGLSEITIKVHRRRVMEKMGAESLADLVRLAERLGPFDTKV